MRFVRERMPKSPYVVGRSLIAHSQAMFFAENSPERFSSLRRAAGNDLKLLNELSHSANSHVIRAWYLTSFGSEDEADEAWLALFRRKDCKGRQPSWLRRSPCHPPVLPDSVDSRKPSYQTQPHGFTHGGRKDTDYYRAA